MEKYLEKLKNKQDLSFNESKDAFEILMKGKVSDDDMFKFFRIRNTFRVYTVNSLNFHCWVVVIKKYFLSIIRFR